MDTVDNSAVGGCRANGDLSVRLGQASAIRQGMQPTRRPNRSLRSLDSAVAPFRLPYVPQRSPEKTLAQSTLYFLEIHDVGTPTSEADAGDGLGAVVGAEFRVDVVEVFVDGAGGDVEERGDLVVLSALGDQSDDLAFARGEPVDGGG